MEEINKLFITGAIAFVIIMIALTIKLSIIL